MNFKIIFPTCLDPPRGSVNLVTPLVFPLVSIKCTLRDWTQSICSATLPTKTFFGFCLSLVLGPPGLLFKGSWYVVPTFCFMTPDSGVINSELAATPCSSVAPPNILARTFCEAWFFPLRRRAGSHGSIFILIFPQFWRHPAFWLNGQTPFMEAPAPPDAADGPGSTVNLGAFVVNLGLVNLVMEAICENAMFELAASEPAH